MQNGDDHLESEFQRQLVDGGDWGLGRIPPAGDDVVINTASPITVTYDSAAPSVAVNSLTVGADNFDVAGGNTLSITSSASFGGLLEVDQGILNFNTVNASIASFDQTGGTISGTGTLTVSGAATFDVGGNGFEEETGTGTTLLQGTTTYSYGYIGLDGGRVLENAGTFNVSLTAAYYFTLGYNPYETAVGGGTIKNDSGATFDFQSASAITNGAGTNTFVNAGTLEQTVTTGTTDIGVALTNTGAVSVQTGTLEFDGGGTSTAGAFTVASGATLDFNGGTFTLSGEPYSGAGVEQVSGGTMNLTGHGHRPRRAQRLGRHAQCRECGGGGLPLADVRHDRGNGHVDGFRRGDVQREQLRTGDRRGNDAPPGNDGRLRQLCLPRRGARAGERGHVQCDGKRLSLSWRERLWNQPRRRHDQERFRRDLRLPVRVERLQLHRRDRVRERGHAGADGHHRDDRHPGRAHQHRRGVGADRDAAARRRRHVHRRNIHRGERGHARLRRRHVHPVGRRFQRRRRGAGVRQRYAHHRDECDDRIRLLADRRHDRRRGHADVSGAATFSGGSYDSETGTGTTLLQGTTTDSSPSYITLDGGRVLENAGTFNVTGTGDFYLGYNPCSTGRRRHDPERHRRDVRLPGRVERLQLTPARTRFVNAGTLEQTVTTGTTDIEVALANTGAVSVQTGTLEFDGGGSSAAGTFTVASGATLDFDGGTFTLSGDAFSAAGLVQVSGGATNFTGATIASRARRHGRHALDRCDFGEPRPP